MEDSLRGQFLLASKHLLDPNFFRTTVLILEHGEEGAMGVVVNRPSSVNVASALAGHIDVCDSESVIHVGGPVEPSALSMLHENSNWGGEDLKVAPGIFVGVSEEAFKEIVKADFEEPGSRFRIYSGYAGWQSEQLEAELERGDWFALPASGEFVFHSNPYNVWDDLLSEFHKQHRILPIPADKAEWN